MRDVIGSPGFLKFQVTKTVPIALMIIFNQGMIVTPEFKPFS